MSTRLAPLSETGWRWMKMLETIYDDEFLDPILSKARVRVRQRGGREVTNTDLTAILDSLPGESDSLWDDDLLE